MGCRGTKSTVDCENRVTCRICLLVKFYNDVP